jgi:hypothetical protein
MQKFYVNIFCFTKLDDLNEQVKSKTDADDEIMVQVNNKVEEWKVRSFDFSL